MNPGRNDPCPCGSGKKYKKCCLDWEETVYVDEAKVRAAGPGYVAAVIALIDEKLKV